MSIKPNITIQESDFNLSDEVKKLGSNNKKIGAIVTFTGLCRDEENTLSALELEHYPKMAEAEIIRIADEAIERFSLLGITVIHRYGKIITGENIVLVIAAASHRQSAFDGANYLMDFLKTRAPFWKKEHTKDGAESKWVDAKDADDTALDKWKN